jgi:hypothetical protein
VKGNAILTLLALPLLSSSPIKIISLPPFMTLREREETHKFKQSKKHSFIPSFFSGPCNFTFNLKFYREAVSLSLSPPLSDAISQMEIADAKEDQKRVAKLLLEKTF